MNSVESTYCCDEPSFDHDGPSPFGEAWEHDECEFDSGPRVFSPPKRLSRMAGDVMNLSGPAKAVLRELCEYADISDRPRCNPSIALLAFRLCCTPQSVRNQRKELVQSGLVSIGGHTTGGPPGSTCTHEINIELLQSLADEGREILKRKLEAYREEKSTQTRHRYLLKKLKDEAAAAAAAAPATTDAATPPSPSLSTSNVSVVDPDTSPTGEDAFWQGEASIENPPFWDEDDGFDEFD